MRIYLAAVTPALIASVIGFAPSPRAAALKCPPGTPILFPNAPVDVWVLNAKVVPQEALKQVDPKTIESIEIVCANDLHRVFGFEAQRTGVVIFTAPGPNAVLDASLQSIGRLQKAYLAKHKVFAKTLSDLEWNDPSGLISVTLSVAQDGNQWAAVGTHRYMIKSVGKTVSGDKTSAGPVLH